MHFEMGRRNLNTKHSDDDYTAMKLMLSVFKFIGLAPFTVRQRSVRSKQQKKCAWENTPSMIFSTCRYGCAYNLCLMAFQVCILITAAPIIRDEREGYTDTSYAISIVGGLIGHIALSVTWLILGCRQKVVVSVLNRLFSFDGTTLGLNESHLPESGHTFIAVVCAMNVIVNAGIVYIDHVRYGDLVSNYLKYIVPGGMCAWAIAQYTFVNKLIENRFKALNRMLLDFCVPPVPHRNFGVREVIGNRITTQNIATLRRAHSNLSQIASDTSVFYSVPMLHCVAYSCYSLVVNAYCLLAPYVKTDKHTPITFADALLGVFEPFVSIALLATGVTNVVEESKKSRDAVEMLLAHPNNSNEINIELDNFLLELLHRKVEFTVCGLFSLDLTLVRSIIGMVIAYLVILLQTAL